MTMKTINTIILALLAMMLLIACDEIPVAERLTYVEPPEVGRAVLIEDYTGQYCVNCPRATEEIEKTREDLRKLCEDNGLDYLGIMAKTE